MNLKNLALAGAAVAALAGATLVAGPAFSQSRDDTSYPYTTNSTPEERAQTSDLNREQKQNEDAADAQNNASQQTYQQQQQDYQARQQQYVEQQDRYRHRLAHYNYDRSHPSQWWNAHYYSASVNGFYRMRRHELIGREVDERDGLELGRISDVDRDPDGQVARVQISLDGGRMAWIDSANLRYDPADRVMFTDIPADDLYNRSHAGYYNPRP